MCPSTESLYFMHEVMVCSQRLCITIFTFALLKILFISLNAQVCSLLRRLTGGSLPSSASCSTESDSACCPTACSEPRKRAVTDIFNVRYAVKYENYLVCQVETLGFLLTCMVLAIHGSILLISLFLYVTPLQAAGVSLDSNMFRPSPPFVSRPPPVIRPTDFFG